MLTEVIVGDGNSFRDRSVGTPSRASSFCRIKDPDCQILVSANLVKNKLTGWIGVTSLFRSMYHFRTLVPYFSRHISASCQLGTYRRAHLLLILGGPHDCKELGMPRKPPL